MAEIDDAAILRRAKELARQDGNDWQYEFKPPLPPGTKIPLRPALDAAGQQGYLAVAREQLTRERDDA
jgi:hypothetical protein